MSALINFPIQKPQLGLGTVQFGVNYGVANEDGVPSIDQVKALILRARQEGVTVLDTASLYGDSESILGSCDLSGFSVITKTPKFDVDIITNSHVSQLTQIFLQSLKNLNKNTVEGLLCHHAPDLLVAGGEKLWQAMADLKNHKRVNKIGASIYSGEQLDQLMNRYPLDIIQLPLNVLDQRLIEGGQLERAQEKGIDIHVRSVFLQGLLLMKNPPAYFLPIHSYLRQWQQALIKHQLTATQAALSFIRDLPGVNVVLVGVQNQQQLLECTDAFNSTHVFDGRHLACNIPGFVDPSKWALTGESTA